MRRTCMQRDLDWCLHVPTIRANVLRLHVWEAMYGRLKRSSTVTVCFYYVSVSVHPLLRICDRNAPARPVTFIYQSLTHNERTTTAVDRCSSYNHVICACQNVQRAGNPRTQTHRELLYFSVQIARYIDWSIVRDMLVHSSIRLLELKIRMQSRRYLSTEMYPSEQSRKPMHVRCEIRSSIRNRVCKYLH